MNNFQLTYKPYGNMAILIEWPAKIDIDIIRDIINFELLVAKEQHVQETIIAYHSLTVQYKKPYKSLKKEVDKLSELYAKKEFDKPKRKSKIWEIPVCYDEQFGLDIVELSADKNITIETLIEWHTKPNYLLYFYGFLPGFPYLGGLNKKLFTPRRETPRLRIKKGSVGIGGEQTGIYPQDSSGGWNIIGKTPVTFFDNTNNKPLFANPGDYIRFKSIDIETFNSIEKAVSDGKYKPIFTAL